MAPVDRGHFVSKISLFTGPQRLDEAVNPATPPLKTIEEFPEGVLVAPPVEGGTQSILVTCREAVQVRQNFQNMDTAKLAVIAADIPISLFLCKRHCCQPWPSRDP